VRKETMNKDVQKLNYQTLTIDLSVAHTNTEYKMAGFFDHLTVTQITGSASIRLNEKTRDLIDLTKVVTINSVFDRFFLTNTAQNDATLVLAIGGDASFKAVPSIVTDKDHVYTTGPVSTAAYVVIVEKLYIGDAQKVLIFMGETGGVNGITFRICGSSLGSTWHELPNGVVPVAASGTDYRALTDAWRYLQVELKDTVGGSHGDSFVSIHKLRA